MSEPLELEPIKAREKAATPGPWTNPWTSEKDHADAFYAPKTDSPANAIQPNAVVCSHPWDGGTLMVREHDAAFIAASRSDVPALVAEVERLRGANGRLRGTLGLVVAFEGLNIQKPLLDLARETLETS